MPKFTVLAEQIYIIRVEVEAETPMAAIAEGATIPLGEWRRLAGHSGDEFPPRVQLDSVMDEHWNHEYWLDGDTLRNTDENMVETEIGKVVWKQSVPRIGGR